MLMANYGWKKATDPDDVANFLSDRHPSMPIRNAMVTSVLIGFLVNGAYSIKPSYDIDIN